MSFRFGLSIKSVLHYLSVTCLSLPLRHALFQVLVEYAVLFEVRDVTCAIVRQGPSLMLVFETAPPLGRLLPFFFVDFVLFVFDEVHELLYVLYWVDVQLVVGLALWAVHEGVLLAHEVLHNSSDLWRDVSLIAVGLKVLDVLCKFVKINCLFEGLALHLSALSFFLSLFYFFFLFYEHSLVVSQLLLQDLVSYFQF